MIKLVKGFRNISSNQSQLYVALIEKLNQTAQGYGFKPVFVPTVEEKQLFQKPIGPGSDISQKEFFYCSGSSLTDNQLVLRPELTTGIVNYFWRSKQQTTYTPLNFFTYGSCFRYEKPQHGRYREFWQWNFDQLYSSYSSIVSVLSFLNSIFTYFQIKDQIVFQINYLTTGQLEKVKQEILKQQNVFSFCSICQKRFVNSNVYAILDCQSCGDFFIPLIDLESFLTPQEQAEYQKYYQRFQTYLPGIKVVKQKILTRGLDYYSGLVFEVKLLNYSWSKNTLLAGGTYLLEKFSDCFPANATGFGFAFGIDRFIDFLVQTDRFSVLLPKAEKVIIGCLDSSQTEQASTFQQMLVNKQFITFLVDGSCLFFDLLKLAVMEKFQWLIFFGNEYQKEQKVVVRKIMLTKTKKYFQKILPIAEVVSVIERESFNN